MATYYRTQGIVLAKRDRGESDRIFTVFTKDFGTLDVWAISERKITSKLRGGLEILYLSELEFVQGRSKKTLTDSIVLERFSVIRNDLARMRVAFRILETLLMFLRGQIQDKAVWDLLHNSLGVLNREDFPKRRFTLLYYYFFWNFISCLGWRPRVLSFGKEVAHMLSTLLSGDISLLSNAKIDSFSTSMLNTISKRYFLEIQKEVH